VIILSIRALFVKPKLNWAKSKEVIFMERYRDAKGNEYNVDSANYLGDRHVRDSCGNTVAILGSKNSFGETPIRDTYGNSIGTVGRTNYLGDIPIRNTYGTQVGRVEPPNYLRDSTVKCD